MENNIYHKDDYQEITLKDIILKVLEYLKYLLSNWKPIILFAFVLGILFAVLASTTPIKYSEKLTYMMDEKSGESLPGMDLIGNLFGAKNQDTNLGKILELFASRNIIHKTLFDTISIDGKNDFIANHILDKYTVEELVGDYKALGFYYLEKWPKRLLANPDFRFSSSDTDSFGENENLYLNLIYNLVNGNPNARIPRLLSSELDEDSGIMTISMKSDNQDITLGILNNIYIRLSDFFIEKSIEKQQKTYDIMKEKRDSVIGVLKTVEYQLADFKDSNRNLETVKGYLKELRLEREVAIHNVMYAEVVKQLEVTDFSLKNKTPVVQVIDFPRRPIIPTVVSWKVAFVKYSMLGGVLMSILLMGFKFFKDVMD